MIRAPGIYPGLPMADYLGTHAVSASILKAVNDECPRAGWFQSWLNPKPPGDDSGAAQNAGTIAHGILLEGGNTANVAVIDPRDFPTKTTGNIPDGWTNKDIRAARDAAIAEKKIPVLAPQMGVIRAMVDQALAFIESLRETEPAIWALFQPGGGDSELTMVWDDNGVPCRMRPDRISADRKLCADYKTTKTSAEPDAWGRTQLVGMGYYTSAAFYRRGVKALCNVTPDYVFLVQQQDAPFLCSLVGINPMGYDLGSRKIARALGTWSACAKSGVWPAYPNRVCYPDFPPWELARFEEKEGGPGGVPYDVEKVWDDVRARDEGAPIDAKFLESVGGGRR